MTKLKAKDVKATREKLLAAQGGICALCSELCSSEEAVLDHCHKGGYVRAVLHNSCNSALGSVENAMVRRGVKNKQAFANGIGAYLGVHSTNQTGLTHHTHRTLDEKKALATKRRKAKAKLKKLSKKDKT
jgi:hypothetical protein